MKIRTLLTGLALAGLVGCTSKPSTNLPTPEKLYFASLPMNSQVLLGMAMAMFPGDFDKDGDLDVIVGVGIGLTNSNEARLYFLENDGEGNFTLKQYPNAKAQEGEQ